MYHFGNSWDQILKQEYNETYYQALRAFLISEYRTHQIYPPMDEIFQALVKLPFEDVKVVILGQDPYHGRGQANGLAFSVAKGVPLPPSLQNIYKELKTDLGISTPTHGDLTKWVESGVLLLNTTLTVREGAAASHRDHGWETFTDHIILALNESKHPLVFLLWGAHAQAKRHLIHRNDFLVLTAPHPSPLSAYRGFFGCRHFSKTNTFLQEHGLTPIDWGEL